MSTQISNANIPRLSPHHTPSRTPQRTHSPRPMGFVSPISDTNIQHEQHLKDKNLLQSAVHYLKNAVTLEPTADEKERERHISDHKHVNDHGGPAAEAQFWEKHRKGSAQGKGKERSAHVSPERHGKQ
ncbi:hypothetical protein CC86DRAFT_374261 [Ophiobolus disseminans]|uniref:Uncharacterized protein n=1 Tax=Ophiobolus disseminans TaxID=1469910 RepID=A0A6A6ZHW3_9PLEO|nr:hypothetical protein CC86DRAFT_374261 [Ophiobolus disseminans]